MRMVGTIYSCYGVVSRYGVKLFKILLGIVVLVSKIFTNRIKIYNNITNMISVMFFLFAITEYT